MSNYYNSGFYMESFFTKHKEFNVFDNENILDDIQYDFDLFAKYHKGDLDYKTQDDLRDQLNTLFWEYLGYWPTYLEPLTFNGEIALECSLTPFTIDKLCLLALSGCGMDFSPRLDAYQALTNNTIDERSYLFLDFDYFEYVVGKTLTERVLEAISYAQ